MIKSRNLQSFIVALALIFTLPLTALAVDCTHEYVYSQNPDGSYKVYCQLCETEVNPDHCILYTTTNNNPVTTYSTDFGASIISNTNVVDKSDANVHYGVILFDDNVTKIGENAFFKKLKKCYLSSIILPNTVLSIETAAFLNSQSITTISLGNSLQSIKSQAFSGCTSLTGTLELPSSLQSIYMNAFSSCENLTSFELHSLPYIEVLTVMEGKINLIISNNSFVYFQDNQNKLPSLESVSFKNNIIKDWNSAILPFAVSSNSDVQLYKFETLVDATHIMVSPVDEVAANTPFIFKRKRSDITEVTLSLSSGKVVPPTSATYSLNTKISGYTLIGNYGGCNVAESNSTTSVYALSGDTFTKQDNSFDVANMGIYLALSEGTSSTPASITISDQFGVMYYTSTDGNAVTPFNPSFGTNLLSNSYDNVQGKGTMLFEGQVSQLGANAFKNCTTLQTIDVPSTVTSVGNYAFSGCSSLTSLTIPEGVTALSTQMCAGCTNLATVVLPSSLTSLGSSTFANCSNLTSINIPEGIQTLPSSFFSCCSKLPEVTLPSSLTSIADRVFTQCTSMQSIAIPSSVSSIDHHAFDNCTALKSITIPNGITTLSSYLFQNCTSLTTVNLPEGISSVEENCFRACKKLKSISLPKVTELPKEVFYGCQALATVNIPLLKTVGTSAFYDCEALSELPFPALTTINNSGFERCYSLLSNLDLGNVTYIGDKAFSSTYVKDVSINSLPSLGGNNVFSNVNSRFVLPLDDTFKVNSSTGNYTCKAAITYTRNMTDRTWGTAMFPFNVVSDEHVQYYTLSSADAEALNFTPVAQVAANNPFLFKKLDSASTAVTWTSSQLVTPASLYTATDIISDMMMEGTYEKQIDETGIFFLSHDAFYYAEDPITIKPFRSWVIECTVSPSWKEAAMMRIRIVGEIEDEITSLLEVGADGNLHEVQNEAIVDLQGRPVNTPAKGQINLLNGKKMMIK